MAFNTCPCLMHLSQKSITLNVAARCPCAGRYVRDFENIDAVLTVTLNPLLFVFDGMLFGSSSTAFAPMLVDSPPFLFLRRMSSFIQPSNLPNKMECQGNNFSASFKRNWFAMFGVMARAAIEFIPPPFAPAALLLESFSISCGCISAKGWRKKSFSAFIFIS